MNLDDKKIAIIGLGYVGLPLAVAFGVRRPVIGFDISEARIAALRRGEDSTLETDGAEISAATGLVFTTDRTKLKACGIFIVTVPTPIDKANRPDLAPLVAASKTVGEAISPGAVVVFESTVYPGCTEEVCAPWIEKTSGLRFNKDFFLGYSPERVNPGDREHRLQTIVKVTSGSTPEAANAIDALYASIVSAGTHLVGSIAVAEAAKVIENTQRDLNIALMNELSLIFGRLGIDTSEVLAAAGTKWNFLRFTPGLVGGHCIGVDPYYLTHKAQELGYHPEVILAGRRINDGMGQHAADQAARLMMRKGISVVGSRILVMGAAFKENCPDLRNSKVADIVSRLQEYNAVIDIWDPWVSPAECAYEVGLPSTRSKPEGRYDGIVVAVGHREFQTNGIVGLKELRKNPGVIYDIKGIFPKEHTDGRF
ncbi:nucleotide sugar dehydrogenase [Mesorhizobium huakuii]|uniref:Nucleotide sugar dehydrogenase n=1 Tax=Mesorhizobium huakuii TaxID=28104 RepID=A0A7G6T541_9HYPH|nr:nucleotide sugar dehydrogenase [Mesorhizobium huakuii]QND61873.1 nucleotide sugar dehydrogenase [Mesorhizobium huakuii]QND69125.1 nucleotide sugar dehydrogenase [Mesorhizobium loti]